MKNKDPLKVLLVDEKQGVDFSLLANLLKHFVIISKESKEIEFLAPYYGLKNKDRILIVLFATKARAELFNKDEKLSQKEIINLGVMPEGSVKADLKGLFDKKKIKKEGVM